MNNIINYNYNFENKSENKNCNYTANLNGTSFAAPIVSGAVALILEANPDLNWRQVKHILAYTAKKIDDIEGSKQYLEAIDSEDEDFVFPSEGMKKKSEKKNKSDKKPSLKRPKILSLGDNYF